MCSVINAILQIARRRNCKSARRRGAPRAAGAVAIHIFLEASFHRPAVVDQKRSGTTRSLISHQKGMKMSGIVLSASVRQNLLSLQSSADLPATTQSRLATGKKVNTALDNPTNFFTAQSLDGRASDISNLLDGIGNGVQVLQAANAGITSLQKLVDTAKSIANQALQTTVGYSTKSNVSATVAGATALDLRGTTSFTSATAFSNVLYSGAAGGVTAAGAGLTLGGLSGALTGVAVLTNDTSSPPAITAATLLNDAPTGSSLGLAAATVADGDTFTVNGHSITFKAGAAPLAAAAPTGYG